MKVLLLEDDPETADYIARGLRQRGHTVDMCSSGRAGIFLASASEHDAFIVDRMVPEIGGLSVVRAVRAAGLRTPLLFLTSMGSVDDRVEALEAGADDYLVKPFAFTELVARLNALGRRPPMGAEQNKLQVADLELDLLKRTAKRGGRRVELQPQEFRLLEYLMRHAGQIVTRTMLLENVWSFHFDPKTDIIESHLSRLRSKIDRAGARPLLETVRGAGYRIEVP